MHRHIALFIMVLGAHVGLGGATHGGERLLIPEETDFPFYAKGLGHTDPPNSLVVTAFYRSPVCVPKKADPLAPDFDINSDCELFVEGAAIYQEGTAEPVQYSLQNKPGLVVPIWFLSSSDFFAALGDKQTPGVVTVTEAERSESLMIGWAESYSEAVVVGQNSNVFASGVLEDGRTFSVHSAFNVSGGDDRAYRVTVTFDE